MIKVAKFGGSSLSSADGFRRVGEILSDTDRRIAVVSAPGKRFPSDVKVTDILLSICARRGISDTGDMFDRFIERLLSIRDGLKIDFDLESELRTLKENLARLPRDYIVSRGEYFCAKLLAKYVGGRFIDAPVAVRFSYSGAQIPAGDDAAREILKSPLSVIPGFYGGYPNGEIKLLPRGGSDLSGSIVSRLVGADVYENWTDVDGVKLIDPNLVEDAVSVPEMTYGELRELSRLGASVMQEEAVLPLAGIPIHVLDTAHPCGRGTWILPKRSGGGAVGVAIRRGFCALRISKENSAHLPRVMSEALAALKIGGAVTEQISVYADGFTLIASDSGAIPLDDISSLSGVVSVSFKGNVALLGAVSSAGSIAETSAAILDALSKARVEIISAALSGAGTFSAAIDSASLPAAAPAAYRAIADKYSIEV